LTYGDLYVAATSVSTLTVFILGLPRLFLTFKKLFTFGEGCLVLQAVLVYAAHSILHLCNNNNNINDGSSINETSEPSPSAILILLSRLILLSLGLLFFLQIKSIISFRLRPAATLKVENDATTYASALREKNSL
jgi:DMSO reductase anchor subunit